MELLTKWKFLFYRSSGFLGLTACGSLFSTSYFYQRWLVSLPCRWQGSIVVLQFKITFPTTWGFILVSEFLKVLRKFKMVNPIFFLWTQLKKEIIQILQSIPHDTETYMLFFRVYWNLKWPPQIFISGCKNWKTNLWPGMLNRLQASCYSTLLADQIFVIGNEMCV